MSDLWHPYRGCTEQWSPPLEKLRAHVLEHISSASASIWSAVWHCTCSLKSQNRSQLKQTSISEQTIWQICELDSEEMGAVIKLSLLYSENIAVLRSPADAGALKTCNCPPVDIQTG
jgi:hypothetical protein